MLRLNKTVILNTIEKVQPILGTKRIVKSIGLSHSQMFATETMDEVKNVSNSSAMQNWVWAMIAFKPKLFATDKE